MDHRSFSEDITFSDTMNMNLGTVFNSVPTLDDIDLDRYPDPEGYYEGQEEYGVDDDDYVRDDDAMYEPDFPYND
jgi:hypothetical protein